MEDSSRRKSTSSPIVPRFDKNGAVGGGLVDIEVSVISGRGLGNPHKFRPKPSFSVELTLDSETKSTNVKQSEDQVVVWDAGFVFSTTIASSLKIRVYCKHRHFGKDHAIGEASFEVLSAERNKEIEISLYPPNGSTQKTATSSAYLKLHLKVVLSVMFNIELDAEMDIRSANCLKQMERIVGSISSHKFKELPPAWIRLFSSLNTFSSLARAVAELDSKAKVAVGAMAFAIKVLVDQMKRDERIDNLGRVMSDLYTYVIDACSVRKIISFEKTLQRLLTQTAECAYFITDYQKISVFTQRAVINVVSNADTMISNFEAAFGELKIALILGSSLQTTLVSYRILQTVEHIENLIRIDRLPILEDVGWDSEKTCFRGTREKTITNIIRWGSGSLGDEISSSRVCILSGPIGSGKSTIAHTVAKMFHEQSRLGAAIFLHDQILEANSKRISSSIVHQLAGYDTCLHARIAAKIKGDQSLTWADARRQFRALVVETTHAADSKLMMIGPVLIVIDDLDRIHAEEQLKLLTTIAEYSGSLPTNFRILLTCRDDNAVVQNIRAHLTSHVQAIGFDDTDNGNSVNIRQHISQILLDLFSKNIKVATHYQFHDLRDELVKRARGMYFWASTFHRLLMACEQDDDASLLCTLLLSNPLPLSNNDAMDQLYRALFNVFFHDKKNAQHLFVSMIQSPQPTTLTNLDRVACIPPEYAHQGTDAGTAHMLGLIIEVDQDEKGVPLFGVHPSLEDFLTNPHRCHGTGVYINREVPLNQSRSEVCIHIMNQSLRYNICNIEDAMAMNEEIADREARIKQYISKPLLYACCNWTLGFDTADSSYLDKTLYAKLTDFVTNHLLHWIEIMSLLGHTDNIKPTLFRFLRWLQERKIKSSDILHVLTADAFHFVKNFSTMISKAALHTYISALPLMPSDTLLFQQYSKAVIMGRSYSNLNIKNKWTREHIHTDYTTCFCSDGHGTLVALGPRTRGRVIFMDAQTGSYIKSTEHTILTDNKVQSMAFTPDGTHLASVTVKGEVAVHDVRTGSRIHSSNISIADSTTIAYAGNDTTMLIVSKYKRLDGTQRIECFICNALTGGELQLLKLATPIHNPSSIGLCPDGRRLAVPNENGVQLFDLAGNIIDFIAEHPRTLYLEELDKCLVTWSPDAAFIAIALVGESTIRLWSCHDRKTVWTIDIDRTSASAESYAMDISEDLLRIAFAWSYSNNRGHSIFRMQIWDTETARQIGNETVDEGAIRCLKRQLSILPDGHKIVSWSNACVGNDDSPWKSLVYFFSDTSPAYMSDPPGLRELETREPENAHVPTVNISFSLSRPIRKFASKVDTDGWIADFRGTRLILVPYPNFDILTSLHLPTSMFLSLRHPVTKKTVLKYFLKWDERISMEIFT